jgi:hypothetical protein
LTSQQQGLIESAPAQPLRMEWNRNNQIDRARCQKFLTALRHEPPQGFAERNFAAILELLHNLAQGMLGDLVSGVATPSPGVCEIRGAR